MVSNATWRDIWLNEGTTSYLEARLMEVLFGKERADEERLLGYQGLQEGLLTVPAEMQALAPEFSSGDPDVGQDGLEYSKGQLFLENLEAHFGREVFDQYMAAYFEHFAMQAINSEQFLEYIDANLLQQQPGIYSRSQVEEWLYQPGLPEDIIVPASTNLERAATAATRWTSGELSSGDLPHGSWSPQATVYFLKALPSELTVDQLTELDTVLQLSASRNAEISRAWFIQVAQRRYQPAYAKMRAHLARYGRTRLVKPVYAALIANGEDELLAQEIFDQAGKNYHPLTSAAIRRLFIEEKQNSH
jgi:leukotriene-A4 hydrolase